MFDKDNAYTKNDRWIETFTGKKFRLSKPVFDIKDIAHALSLQCRYTGHCNQFYSVAQHSILVSELAKNRLEGLMHDAPEAYIMDMSAPVKSYFPEFKACENYIYEHMAAEYGLPTSISEDTKNADWLALFIEARVLMSSKGHGWVGEQEWGELADKYLLKNGIPGIFYWDTSFVEAQFLVHFEMLYAR